MRVIAINGRAYRVDVLAVLQICFSRMLLIKLILFSAVIAMINPPMFGLELPLWGTFLYWLIMCYGVTILWICQFATLDHLRRRSGGEMTVFAPVIVAIAISGTVWTNYAITEKLFGLAPVPAVEIWLLALRYFLIAMVSEIITVMLILPRFRRVVFENPLPGHNAQVLSDLDPATEPQATAPPACGAHGIDVNGRTIPLPHLHWMKSVEHYVEFHCATGILTERAALRDMVAQTDGADGIQPHRSWWVSRGSVDRLTRRNGNPVLILTDETEVPVSRKRKAEVEAWLTGAADGNKKA